MQRNGYVTVLILLLICFAIPVFNVYSSGTQEDRLSEAETLVEQREYNAAMLILTDILRNEPSRMSDVQNLLTRIRLEKENYNDKYEDLIDVYGGEDVEAAYPMIAELQDMDPNPNEATRVSLVLARETAGFVFNNNRWVKIMEDASAQIAEEEYSAAVETYITGFDLSRIIFRDAGYGNIVVNDVFSRADEMNEESQEFLELYKAMQSRNAVLNSSFELRKIDDYVSAVAESYQEFERTAELRESLKDTADYFIVQEDNIRTSAGEDKQIHYLIYMDRLLNGRTTIEEREGITGAIELYWNGLFNQLVENSFTFTEELFSEGFNSYSGGNYDAAAASFTNVLQVAEQSVQTYDFGERYFESDSQFTRDGLFSINMNDYASKRAYIGQADSVSREFPIIIDRQLKLSELESRVAAIDRESENYREAGSELKNDISAESLEISSALADWERNLSELRSGVTGEDPVSVKSIAAVTIPVEQYGSMEEALLKAEITLAASLSAIDLELLEKEYEIVKVDVEASSELIQGVADGEEADSEGVDFQIVYKYPDQALNQLLATEQSVNNLVSGINTLDEVIDSERAEIRLSPEVSIISDGSSELMGKARELLSQAEKLADIAREQIFTAEKLKQEGERRIEDSRILTQRAQFAAAKERLEQAASKFDESLSYLEDPILRTYRDNEIPRLYEEIQVAENNLVVRQVREYLTIGKTSYSQGNFPAAQAVLIKAQSRWSDTNVELNSEVEYWLTLTQTALSVTSGRIITATDPLYPEMNQFLNQARADFQGAKIEYDR
ncbi:MAG TPA: hypothetical protein DCO79_08360, partial [Spirochaeta sp.]|nr:hypothetical protein [Spirochaeta sp.]